MSRLLISTHTYNRSRGIPELGILLSPNGFLPASHPPCLVQSNAFVHLTKKYSLVWVAPCQNIIKKVRWEKGALTENRDLTKQSLNDILPLVECRKYIFVLNQIIMLVASLDLQTQNRKVWNYNQRSHVCENRQAQLKHQTLHHIDKYNSILCQAFFPKYLRKVFLTYISHAAAYQEDW